LRIGLRKPELPLRWSLRLRAIPCTVPCQGFHFPTFRASHHAFDLESAISLSRGCFVKEKLGQLWSMGTRTFQKVVWCSISVTGNDPGARGARSNANSLRRPDLAEPRRVITTSQIHGGRTDIGDRMDTLMRKRPDPRLARAETCHNAQPARMHVMTSD
jgi:hypothetical protein